MRTNGEARDTHIGGSVSFFLLPLWERQAGPHIQWKASQSGVRAIRISRKEEVVSPDHFPSSLDSMTLLNLLGTDIQAA